MSAKIAAAVGNLMNWQQDVVAKFNALEDRVAKLERGAGRQETLTLEPSDVQVRRTRQRKAD